MEINSATNRPIKQPVDDRVLKFTIRQIFRCLDTVHVYN